MSRRNVPEVNQNRKNGRKGDRLFSSCRNDDKDGAVETSCGNAFQTREATTGKAWSPSVDRRVAGTNRAVVEAERSLCRELDVGQGLQIAGQVDRAESMEATIREDTQFKLHAFWNNRKPD